MNCLPRSPEDWFPLATSEGGHRVAALLKG
jgi:hypothetical protein